jgi:multiple sugar transport system permease protein
VSQQALSAGVGVVQAPAGQASGVRNGEGCGPLRRFTRYWQSPAGREARHGYGFILLWIVGFIVFELGPLIAVFFYSFTSYDVFSAPRWVGTANYERLVADPLVWKSLANTAFVVAVSAPLRLVLALAIALLLNQRLTGIGVFRTIFYLPMMVPVAATAILWAWMLDPRLGVINHVLDGAGVTGIKWMVTEAWSKPAIVLVTTWRIGEPIILFLAGLQAIPRDLYESAEIDGAGWWRKLTSVTIPMLTPTIFMLVVLEIIELFQTFVWAFSMTKGGPLNSSLVYVLYIFRKSFEDFQIGYASALAVLLFAVVLALTLALFRWSRRWVHSAAD